MDANIILIGVSFPIFDCIKTSKIVLENLYDFSSLKNTLLNLASLGEINEKTTLVFDFHSQNDFEIKRFFAEIKPTTTLLFKENWNRFSKSIVVLFPDQSKIDSLLIKIGISGFSKPNDVVDYLEMRNV